MKRLPFLPACVLLLAGCGAEDPTPNRMVMAPEQDPSPEPEMEMEQEMDPPPPPWTPPEIWGHPAAPDLSEDPDVVEVELTAAPTKVTLLDGLELDMYAYNGSVPGPVIQAKVGDEVIVHFQNDLPEPTTIHWHGLRISDEMDGSPRIQDPVQPGETFTYRFTVKEAGSYWYHPHVRSNEQVEKGLYGTLVVHEAADPEFDRERYLVLDDILVSDSGFYPFLASHPELMHGRTGNVLLTNGRATDVSDTASVGQVERWRLVNTSNARTMELTVQGAEMKVVGTDGGRLQQPEVVRRLFMAVGQRYDLEIRYDEPGRVELQSHVLVRTEQGTVEEQPFTVFAVDVEESDAAPTEIAWPPAPVFPTRAPGSEAEIQFDAVQGGPYGIQWTLNGQAHPEEPLFTFTEGQAVRIRLVNNAGPEHPFHLHGQFFEVVNAWPGGIKDTVLVPGLTTVEIIAYFDNPGRWMAHCHILEHAELGMMGEIIVEPK